MIIRVALFITLLAIFYYYCSDGNKSNQFRGPNDINMIEVPEEISPTFIEQPINAVIPFSDSTNFFTSEPDSFNNPTFMFQEISYKN